ncbi:undecaprenyl-phosphate glucose phosphotransferase [Acinetobacter populi]|uniref:Undecaprenyl-phosphate glucose phosphotransferase n=2 Tax=Acinetobacter populi TaxID=1582270 RepID=A0A1Z9YWT2_9GAMM|nr:undecaprenyl-phosphate glucose phosphotransferase [Acinetobacter populi]
MISSHINKFIIIPEMNAILHLDTKNAVLVGSFPITLDKTYRHFFSNVKIIGYYDDDDHNIQDMQCPYLGNLYALLEDINTENIDVVYINPESIIMINDIIDQLKNTTCSIILISNTNCLNTIHISTKDYFLLDPKLENVNDIFLIKLFDTPFYGFNRFIKRAEDIILSIIILILISPILLTVALAIKLTSSGPVLFKQTRNGLNGKPITVFKFRSMKVMENGHEVKQATKNDPRVTKVGAFIRRTSLDELPQFFNVLSGNMSIVGPRPHAVSHNEQYRALIPGYMLRHKVKPGITGLAQIRGWRGETDTLDKMEKRVECDLMYIKNWSLWLDIKIIFLTIFKGFINKSAY